MKTRINDFLSLNENQTTNMTKDITVTDLDGNSRVVVRCHATIIANKSISYYMDVVDNEIFAKHKEVIQEQIELFKEESVRLAKDNNVPII